ncbi:hypothetical protein Kpho02_77970 [Kitasatospora phosalacinea]|uniref:Uncharacterized protein n=1 Tax=Kitasatospora phosalacinea TaxID=2065 RepID=A0A9W6V7Q6_9ACTN|nr:hypothetical protein [Kitasatospora phosalacinea]GLW75500.1 hypothetical protein Kpho02_77970 [Kitasatospora phosalacinea]
MAVHSRLAVLGAGTALGTVLVLGGAPAARACDERPPATAAPTPTQSSTAPAPSPSASGPDSDSASAAPSAARPTPAASLALLPGADRTLVAGGAPVEFTAQVDNTGTAALEGAAPLPALRNDAARSPQQALRADELLLQVKTSAGWEDLPLSVGCDRSLRGDGALPATDLAPGGSARYTFRLSVTAADAAAQQVDVRLGLRSGSADSFTSAPHTTLRITHPAAPAPAPAQPSVAEPAPASASTAPSPRTEVLGVDALPAPVRGGATTPPASDAPTLAAASLPSPADGGRPPTSLLVSGVVLIALGATGFTLVLVHRPARHR